MQILLINDMVGHSKVGMGAMLPVLSYLGHPTFNLPTALVSNTFDYGKFRVLDTTEYIRETLPVWKELGFRCDAICTGCMFSEEQATLVADYCREQSAQGTVVFVDPVMGDGGRLYNGMTMRQVDIMRRMVAVADLTFPNYTEASLLAGMPFRQEGISREEAIQLVDKLREIGAKSVIVTSCVIDGQHCVAGYNHADNDYFFLNYEEIPGLFHGTGDLFSAILIGHVLNQEPLKESTRRTMDAIYKIISLNKDLDDKHRGILIEQFLNYVYKSQER
ncbi:MAG: bifunctional hydroxymethylpyrimidine kinase/phosphomethylpyrimidine kinase [Prevotella sp.]|nr:bifunctional hydroxymethylpyrimidine kinase/phosphomethylpyrimidine kinase [Prevotella sp.]